MDTPIDRLAPCFHGQTSSGASHRCATGDKPCTTPLRLTPSRARPRLRDSPHRLRLDAARRAQAPAPIKFGMLTALSGPYVPFGQPLADGVRMAVEEVNAQGGLEVAGKRHMVQIVERDTRSDVRAGPSRARPHSSAMRASSTSSVPAPESRRARRSRSRSVPRSSRCRPRAFCKACSPRRNISARQPAPPLHGAVGSDVREVLTIKASPALLRQSEAARRHHQQRLQWRLHRQEGERGHHGRGRDAGVAERALRAGHDGLLALPHQDPPGQARSPEHLVATHRRDQHPAAGAPAGHRQELFPVRPRAARRDDAHSRCRPRPDRLLADLPRHYDDAGRRRRSGSAIPS